MQKFVTLEVDKKREEENKKKKKHKEISKMGNTMDDTEMGMATETAAT